MAKYLSSDGARHLVNKIKENFVPANESGQAAYAVNAGYSDTAGSANSANRATNDAAGNPIQSTYLTISDAAETYLTKDGTAVNATNAVMSSSCTGNAENSTRLATPRKINVADATESNTGTPANFDGTSDVTIKLPPTLKVTVDGNSSTATRATSDGIGNVIANHYAPNYNPVFTGTPQAPTANDGTNNNQLATTAFVQAAIKNVVGTAPEALSTLYELAEAINQDKNFATTMSNALAGKQDLNAALTSLSNLETSADKMIYTNAADSYVTTDLTAFIRTLLDDVDASTARQTLDALGKSENAVSATKLETAREISISDGVNTGTLINFDGTKSITLSLPEIIKANLNGNADSATNADFAKRAQQDADGNIISKIYAPISNPVFKGTPQAPTPASDVSNDQIATTKFVSTMIENLTENHPALLSISNLDTNADKMIYTTAPNVYATTDLTEFARKFLADVDADTARQTLNALGKTENAVSATNADFSTKAQQDADGNVISEKYMPKISSVALNIPNTGWRANGENFYYEFEIENLTAADVVNINITPENHGLCVDCGLCPTCEITDGKVKLLAKAIPTAEISAEFYILKGASSSKIKSYGSVNCSTSQRVIIYKTPAQVATLTYNGNIQTPTWDDYDPNKLLMIDEVSGINAGTYTTKFIPIGNCTWSDDSRAPRTQTWKIDRATIFKIPSQSGNLTFNGGVQSPVLENFNPDELTLSGDFEKKVDAGTYTAYATPTSNYIFSDGSIDAKSFTWKIDKAAQIIQLDKNSLELENISMSDTVIVNRLGDGKISVTSSDENIVTVSNIDSEVKVTAIASGDATITINVAEWKNYTVASVTIPVKNFVIKPLIECTPAEIVQAIQSGKAPNAWDVGDLTTEITLNGKIGDALTLENFKVRAMLIGFNHNSELESGGKNSAHFILSKDITLIDSNYDRASATDVKYFQHNAMATNIGGWKASSIRTDICADIFNALPKDWQKIISPCTKYTDNTGGGVDDPTFVTPTADKIFILSEYEVFGKRSYSNLAESYYQAPYEYFTNGNSKIRYSHVDNEKPCSWWLRSAQILSDTSFCRVSADGGINTYNARYSQGVTPAFMVC